MPTESPSTIESMTAALRARLATLSIQVDLWPDKPGRAQFTHPVACVWVGYGGSRFDDPSAVDVPVQDRVARFELCLLVRALNGPKGAGAHLDAIRALTHGWLMAGAGVPFRYVSEAFVDHDNGVWRYDVAIETKLVAVPAEDASTDPRVTRIQLESEFDTSVLNAPEGGP